MQLSDTAEQPSGEVPGNPNNPNNIIQLSEDEFSRGASWRQRSRLIKSEENHNALDGEDHVVVQGASCEKDEAPDEAVPKWLVEAERIIAEGGLSGKPLGYRFIKRAFDIVFSSCVIVVGLVPGLILSAFVARDTKGTPLYSSTRTGVGGRQFKILKFRTMVADSDDLEKYFSPEQLDQWHREHKVENDPRITTFGSFLRATSIDEFPQFFNVLIGQMSTVGCRAITEEELEYFGKARDLLLSMRPGITGLWQTGPRNIATFESGIRQELDLAYIESANAKLDLRLILKTLRSMAARTGK